MAFRLDSRSDGYRRTVEVPNPSAFTACGWAAQVSDLNEASVIFCIENSVSNGTLAVYIGVEPDGTTLAITTQNGSDFLDYAFPSQYSLGTYFFWALVGASSGNVLTGYAARAVDASLQTIATTAGVSFSSAAFFLGTDSTSAYFNGTLYAPRVWDVTLTQAEIEQERWAIFPQRLSDLVFFNPGLNHPMITQDWTGTGNLTVLGTPTIGDNPPIPYQNEPDQHLQSLPLV
jgi:hypothetical protein